MNQYPLEFRSSCKSPSGIATIWRAESGQNESVCAIPPEFSGPGGGLSPEDLFNQALSSCFVATFKVLAQNSRLAFDSVEVASLLSVAPGEESGRPVMKDFHLEARIVGVSDSKKALLLAKKASESGFILNSVKTSCRFSFSAE